jgi:hypothetical protein
MRSTVIQNLSGPPMQNLSGVDTWPRTQCARELVVTRPARMIEPRATPAGFGSCLLLSALMPSGA